MAKTSKASQAPDTHTPEQIAAEKEMKRQAKAAKFKEVGAKRMTNALKQISLLGNLANKGQYEYSPEQIAKMGKSLTDAVDAVLNKFTSSGKVQSGGFEF